MRAYERQHDDKGVESTQAFEAWCAYRDWGIDRSYHKVAEWLSKSDTIIKRWASRWDWQGRLQAYSDWQEMIGRDAVAEEERKKASDLVQRELKLDEEMLSLKEEIIPRLKQMMKFPLVRTEHRSEDGKAITYIHPAKWSFNTVARFLEVMDKTPDRLDITVTEEMQEPDLSVLTDEELRSYVASLEKLANSEDEG